MIETVAYLLTEIKTEEKDEVGHFKKEQVKKEVFVEITSISSKEFASASTVGEKPEKRALLFYGDYDGETKIEIEEVVYQIYRTFFNEKTEKIELYLTRRLHDKQN